MRCFVSTKTTGLKPEKHEVIELSIKPFGLEVVSFKIRPDKLENYEEHVQKINGLSKEIVQHFPDKETAKTSVLSLFNNITPIGHYFKFDYGMLEATFGPEFLAQLFGVNKAIDTAMMINNINIACVERGQPVMFKKDGLQKVALQLGIPFTHKCEVIEQVYKRIENGN